MNSYDLRQFKQRVSLLFHLTSLGLEETYDYIIHRLQVAGGNGKAIFTEKALRRIATLSRGIPRVINIICDASLLAGFVDGVQSVDDWLVDETISEIQLDFFTQDKPDSAERQKGHPEVGALSDQFHTILQSVNELCHKFPMETHLLALLLNDGSAAPMKELLLKNFGHLYQLERQLESQQSDVDQEEEDEAAS